MPGAYPVLESGRSEEWFCVEVNMGKSDRKKKTRKTNCFIRSSSFVLLKTEHSRLFKQANDMIIIMFSKNSEWQNRRKDVKDPQ